jgi:hypothetical protein
VRPGQAGGDSSPRRCTPFQRRRAGERPPLLMRNGKIAAVGTRCGRCPERPFASTLRGSMWPRGSSAATQRPRPRRDQLPCGPPSTRPRPGRSRPNVKAWVSVNPDSEIIPVARSNGVLLALTAPAGGLLAGQSAVMQLDGWTYEDLTAQARRRRCICDWPAMAPVISTGRPSESAKEQLADRVTRPRRRGCATPFDDARAYASRPGRLDPAAPRRRALGGHAAGASQ